jgi:hypothetical protein
LLVGDGPRLAERIEHRAERLGVGLEHGVDQPQGKGVEAAGLRLQPSDPAHKSTGAGIPTLIYGGSGHDQMIAQACQVCVK